MRDIRVATAQFEPKDNDRSHNLDRIRELTQRAAQQDAEIVSFHECCIPGYTWLQPLDKRELLSVAEPVPDGPSTEGLTQIAQQFGLVVMAGLLERDEADQVFNAYVAVGPDGCIAKYRKLHPFVNPHLTPGKRYVVVDLLGCKVGFSICYDNNLPENVRMTTMLGAEIVIMPHVTCCVPSDMPGRGPVRRELWENRHRDPVSLRQEFRGPKGRQWLMRWLPARAWENGIYAVFSNPIGWDYDTVKPGLAMIVDPNGDVLVESHALDEDVVVGLLTEQKIDTAPGRRYLKARRPELYGKLLEPQHSETLPGWKLQRKQPSD